MVKDNMFNIPINKELEELLYNPLVLLTVKDETILNQFNNLIPYSTGFEIECDKKSSYNVLDFTTIPYIMDVNTDSSEQRYRIPNGIRGLICLFIICEQLKNNSELNFGSGIHYHLDTTDCFDELQGIAIKNKDWILNELDTWDLKGCTQPRTIQDKNRGNGFIVFNSLRTFEFRIGEMSFDYEILVNRIIHANNIVKRLKDEINISEPTFEPVDSSLILTYLKNNKSIAGKKLIEAENKLKEFKEEKKKNVTVKPVENIQEVINSRVIRI